jgi:hypothetical protein
MDSIKCPKCKEGVMKLPLANKLLGPGYADKGGAKLVCTKCSHQARTSAFRQSKTSN